MTCTSECRDKFLDVYISTVFRVSFIVYSDVAKVFAVAYCMN